MKGGEPIRGDILRVGLTSPPHIDTRRIKVRIMSGESPLVTREEGSRRKEGVYHYDTLVKGVPLEMSFSLNSVSLLQSYILLTSWTSQGLYLRQEAFV